MATGISSVIPSGYLSSEAYSSLSTSQQRAANAAQSQLNSQASLVAQSFNSLRSNSPILSLQANASTTISAAAQSGLAAQQSSANDLALGPGGSDATSGGLGISTVAQLSVLTALTRAGLTGKASSGGTSSEDTASAIDAAKANQQSSLSSLVSALSASSTGGAALTGDIVSLYYSQKASSAIGALYSAKA